MAETRSGPLNFGTAIAFVAPGFLALKGVSYHSGTVREWLAAAASKDQGVGVFLFVVLGSIALGIGVSGLRALLIDNLLHWKRLKGWSVTRTQIDWSRLDDSRREGLNTLIEGFYRYYQFYSNSLIALLILLIARLSVPPTPNWGIWHLAAVVVIAVSLFWSARDSYRKYCESVNVLFSSPSIQEET